MENGEMETVIAYFDETGDDGLKQLQPRFCFDKHLHKNN